MFLSNILAFAEGGSSPWTTVFFIVIAVAFLGMMVWSSFNNRKRDKKAQEMLSNVGPGDKVKTVGGLVGTIVQVITLSPTEKLMVIESGIGDNKTTMTYDIRAIGTIMEHANTPAINPDLLSDSAQKETVETQPADADTVDVAEATAPESESTSDKED